MTYQFTLFSFLALLISSLSFGGLKGIELPGLKSITESKARLGLRQKSPIGLEAFLTHQEMQPRDTLGLLIRFSMEEEWHIYGTEEEIGTPTHIRLLSDEFQLISQTLSPSKVHTAGEGDLKIISHWLENKSFAFASLSLKENLILPPETTLRFEVVYQPCTKTTCLRKMTKEFSIPLKIGRTRKVQIENWMEEIPAFLAILKPVDDPVKTQKDSSPEKLLDQGAWMALLSAFLWGLLASLTPCVYPMIPITVSLFSQGSSQSRGKRVFAALVYVLGIALSYAALGMAASYSGKDLGSWLANPYVAVSLAILMVLLALSMFGLFELDLPYSLKEKLNQIEGTSPITLFLMGGVMGFVAAPCVGPFFGAIMIWLVKNPGEPIFGFLMMLSFGLGLGVLFLMVALFSQSILPKSGTWMVTLKKAMGFVLLGMALYFLNFVLDKNSAQMAWGIYILCAGSLMGAFVSLSWDDPWWKKISRGTGILLFAYGSLLILQTQGFLISTGQPSQISTTKQKIFTNHNEALQEGLRQKKPVFLYFGAKWCIPCKKIKEVVLKDSRVKRELNRFIFTMLDCTKDDSHGARVKKEVYNSPHMPFFAFHSSNGKHLQDLDINRAVGIEELLEVLKQVP